MPPDLTSGGHKSHGPRSNALEVIAPSSRWVTEGHTAARTITRRDRSFSVDTETLESRESWLVSMLPKISAVAPRGFPRGI